MVRKHKIPLSVVTPSGPKRQATTTSFYVLSNSAFKSLSAGLRRRSTAARLLRSWVRIPPGGMDVCCECCVLSEVSATGCSLVQRSPTDCGASLCVIQKPHLRGLEL